VANRPATTAPPRTDEASPSTASRRQFLSRLSIWVGALGGLIVATPIVGFLLAPLIRRAGAQWSTVGPVGQFTIGETVEAIVVDPSPLAWAGLASRTAIWLRRDNQVEFTAFSVNCTHLGCPVRWLAGGNIFLCPCHGGVFYADGTVAGGPPQHPLVRFPTRVRNEQVEVLSGLSPIGAEVDERDGPPGDQPSDQPDSRSPAP
jgi:menaquinol-cytochrome c reductase iron-sulfur subunit